MEPGRGQGSREPTPAAATRDGRGNAGESALQPPAPGGRGVTGEDAGRAP